MIVMVPTLGAGLIAISRIMDARHHAFDVITGSLLGVICGWAGYRQFFPQLSDHRSKGRAYPIRKWGTEPLARTESTPSDEVKLTDASNRYRRRRDSATPDYLEAGLNRRGTSSRPNDDYYFPTDDRLAQLEASHNPPGTQGQSIELSRL